MTCLRPLPLLWTEIILHISDMQDYFSPFILRLTARKSLKKSSSFTPCCIACSSAQIICSIKCSKNWAQILSVIKTRQSSLWKPAACGILYAKILANSDDLVEFQFKDWWCCRSRVHVFLDQEFFGEGLFIAASQQRAAHRQSVGSRGRGVENGNWIYAHCPLCINMFGCFRNS